MIITLLTDFGLSDAYAGVMKGVILNICPDAGVVDLTHGIPPQDREQAAFVLKSAYAYFPEGTIHVAVVDPGVGTGRAALVVRTRDFLFVAPDDGVLKYVFEAHPEARVFRADRPEFLLPDPSATFHGRDIFAPLAGHLALGIHPEALGDPFPDFERGRILRPVIRAGEIRGAILYFDRFGNAVTNLDRLLLEGVSVRAIHAGGLTLGGVLRTYADVPAGEPVAYIGSAGTLEIGVNMGDARARYGLKAGDGVVVGLG
ncbi:MAG TPA: hypothetical protein ENN17_12800, partial [bacterium]|nr:hypothetical protein [bacterium]